MAGLVILSATSSVVQLFDYGCGVVSTLRNVYKKVENSSQRHRDLEDQLHLLIRLRDKFKNSPSFQNWEAKALLEATGAEVRGVEELLCRPPFVSATRPPFRRLWTAVNQDEEKKIEEHLEKLHKQIVGLSSYIAMSTADKVTTIDLRMEEITENFPVNSGRIRGGQVERYVSQNDVAALKN